MTISFWESERTRFEARISEPVTVGELLELGDKLGKKWEAFYGDDDNGFTKDTAVTFFPHDEWHNRGEDDAFYLGFEAYYSGRGFNPEAEEMDEK